MPAEGSTSIEGVFAQQSARVHAGHVYNKVTNNYQTQPAISPNTPSSTSTRSPRIELAPWRDPAHKGFVRAGRKGSSTTRLEYLLSRGANIDAKDDHALTALFYAAFRGDDENVQYLVERGANVNTEHYAFATPVAIAALRGHSGVVKILLQHRADLSNTSKSSSDLGSALHCACFGGNTDIFTTMVPSDAHNDYLACYRAVRIEALSMLSAANLAPSEVGHLRTNPQFYQGTAINCTPIFLAAERCHFNILRLSWSICRHAYFSLSLWNFLDEENHAGPKWISPSHRNNASYNSVESRSGPSFTSKASTSSAWSSLGFPLAAREDTRCTLLMWAAASLNLELIEHLLEAGASALVQDEAGRTALHYASTPFADAAFGHVRECVKLLLTDQALFSIALISPLNLAVRDDNAALDPRACYRWGRDVHQTFVSSFLDPLPTEHERAELARGALPDATSHDLCPVASIAVLCKHAVGYCPDPDALSVSQCMDKSLHNTLRLSGREPVISLLLDYGADPNSVLVAPPLITAIERRASVAVVTKLLEYGANPYIAGRIHPPMTPYVYATRTYQKELITLFEQEFCKVGPPKLTPTHSAHLTAEEPPRIVPLEFESQGLPIATKVLSKVVEIDESIEFEELELNDLNEDPEDELKVHEHPTHTAQDSEGASRRWFSNVTARFQRNSKPM